MNTNYNMQLSVNQPASVNYSMGRGIPGSWDNIMFWAGKESRWKAPPQNVPLMRGPIYVPQGTPLPLANEAVAMEPPKDSMFLFSRNQASPACCNNATTFTTSTGCVCTTPAQRRFVGVNRGGNKNYWADEF